MSHAIGEDSDDPSFFLDPFGQEGIAADPGIEM